MNIKWKSGLIEAVRLGCCLVALKIHSFGRVFSVTILNEVCVFVRGLRLKIPIDQPFCWAGCPTRDQTLVTTVNHLLWARQSRFFSLDEIDMCLIMSSDILWLYGLYGSGLYGSINPVFPELAEGTISGTHLCFGVELPWTESIFALLAAWF